MFVEKKIRILLKITFSFPQVLPDKMPCFFFWEATRGPAEDMAAVAESANKDVPGGWSLSWSRCVPSEDQFCGIRNERVWIAMREEALSSVCHLEKRCLQSPMSWGIIPYGVWGGEGPRQHFMAHVEMGNSFEFRSILSFFFGVKGKDAIRCSRLGCEDMMTVGRIESCQNELKVI